MWAGTRPIALLANTTVGTLYVFLVTSVNSKPNWRILQSLLGKTPREVLLVRHWNPRTAGLIGTIWMIRRRLFLKNGILSLASGIILLGKSRMLRTIDYNLKSMEIWSSMRVSCCALSVPYSHTHTLDSWHVLDIMFSSVAFPNCYYLRRLLNYKDNCPWYSMLNIRTDSPSNFSRH